MLVKDALNILKPDSTDPDNIKSAWRRACSKYHPDKGGSTAMMQAVNEAYETLLNAEHIEQPESFTDYGDELNAAINAIINLPGLDIEVCGAWLWVGGDTKTHKDALKEHGFKWAPKKQKWSFHPHVEESNPIHRHSITMDDNSWNRLGKMAELRRISRSAMLRVLINKLGSPT